MAGHNLVAIFPTYSEAEAARSRLLAAGLSNSAVRLSATQQDAGGVQSSEPAHEGGFWSWLFGDAPDEDRSWYSTNLREGRTALSVYVEEGDSARVHDILEECNPIDVEQEGLTATRSTATAAMGSTGAAATRSTGTAAMGSTTADRTNAGTDQVIPIVKEELEVGKRQTERRFRVRTYTVERPIEEQVSLHDERVVIERRPASGVAQASSDALHDREFEVVERHEEPVVAKAASATEEMVIRKEAADRVETVRDTVRETKVDVDKGSSATGMPSTREAAGNKPSTAPAVESATERKDATLNPGKPDRII